MSGLLYNRVISREAVRILRDIKNTKFSPVKMSGVVAQSLLSLRVRVDLPLPGRRSTKTSAPYSHF